MKIDLHKMVTLFAVLVPLWGGAVFLFTYQENLVKKADLAVMDLDARLERTEIIVAVYSRNPEGLTPDEVNKYDRAKARLINLETQRDSLLRIRHD